MKGLDPLGLFALPLDLKAPCRGVGVGAGLGRLGVPQADGLAVEGVEGEWPDPGGHHPGRAEGTRQDDQADDPAGGADLPGERESAGDHPPTPLR